MMLVQLPRGPRTLLAASLAVVLFAAAVHAQDTFTTRPDAAAGTLPWQDKYEDAGQRARDAKQLLLICFFDSARSDEFRKFRDDLTTDPELLGELSQGWTLAALDIQTRTGEGDEQRRLLDDEQFQEMHGRPGLAILDFRDEDAPYYGKLVSVLPLGKEGAKYRNIIKAETGVDWLVPRSEVLALLKLPPGTLTQRTLIFAVRTHGERPASTDGTFHPVLAAETESHSEHQARIRNQGHHGWSQRFHAINAKLNDGSLAIEVCAESWPGQSLVEAARECVNSWRQSSGHWSAVRGRHRAFGFDIKRGSNGVWYATGIFARHSQ